MKIVSVVNQKGGVGKTMTSINTSTVLAEYGYKVLVVDFDPQGNLSSGFGFDEDIKQKNNIYNVLLNDLPIEKTILKTKIDNLDILLSNMDLAAFETDVADIKNREFILREVIDTVKDKYDFIFFDCPPSLGMLTINALSASTDILIPLQCEFFALEGLSYLLETAERIKSNLNSKLKILGVLLTMYDKRNKLTEQIENDVRSSLGDLVFKTVIPRNVKLTESTSFGVPSVKYDRSCIGSVAYTNFVKEMVDTYGQK